MILVGINGVLAERKIPTQNNALYIAVKLPNKSHRFHWGTVDKQCTEPESCCTRGKPEFPQSEKIARK